MEFAYLFIFSFIVGLIFYWQTQKWWLASVIISLVLILLALSGADNARQQLFMLAWGLPIVFIAGLLGAYVIQLRNYDDSESPESDENDKDTEQR